MVYTMQLLFVGLGAALGIVLFFLRIPLLRVYRISDETRYLANAFFLIQSVVLLTMSYQMPTNAGILRGGGDTRFALVLDLISFWAIVIPLSYLAAFRWHASPHRRGDAAQFRPGLQMHPRLPPRQPLPLGAQSDERGIRAMVPPPHQLPPATASPHRGSLGLCA